MLHARHHVVILARSPAKCSFLMLTGGCRKRGAGVASQWAASSNREPHASVCTHSHPRWPPPVESAVAVHSRLPVSAGMRASDSRIALHRRRACSACHLLTCHTEHKYTSPRRSLRSLSFSLQQACQSQELFLSYAFFYYSFFVPKGLVLVVHTLLTQSNNPPYAIALSVAGRLPIKITKIPQYATNQLFLPTKHSITPKLSPGKLPKSNNS